MVDGVRDIMNRTQNKTKSLADPAEEKPAASAARALIRDMYMRGSVAEYVAKKYDIKGEIGIGEEGIGADKDIP